MANFGYVPDDDGGRWTPSQLADFLGISRQMVHRVIAVDRIVGLTSHQVGSTRLYDMPSYPEIRELGDTGIIAEYIEWRRNVLPVLRKKFNRDASSGRVIPNPNLEKHSGANLLALGVGA